MVVSELIEHLEDEEINNMFNNIKYLLKNNGVLILTCPNNEDLELSKQFCPECGCIYHKWQHLRSFTKNDISNLLIANGFKIKKIETLNWSLVFFNIYNLKRILKYFYLKLKNKLTEPHLVAIAIKK